MNLSLRAVNELVVTHGRNLAIVVNYSGGKDSHRMLGFIREHFPLVKTYAVMADTGFEHVKPIEAVVWAAIQVERFGLDLKVCRNPNKTYLEMVERRGMFPSASQRQCTSDLKRGPIEKFIRHLPEKIIINCTGIRAAESAKRAKQNPWQFNYALSVAGRKVWNWMPIFEESLKDVLNWHWATGQALHPVYVPEYHADGTKGGYLRRFSCRVCIFSTDADIRAIYINDRPAFDAVADIEVRKGFTMKNGKSLFQIVNNQPAEDEKQYGADEDIQAPCSAF